jgi:hypothetical protein
MALVLKDRVRETSTTSGTGTIVLAGAVAGFQSFSAIGNTNTTYYCIADSSTGGWEVGIGTYTSSGTTLSRTTVLASSNSGALVAFSANVKDVFCTYPAGKSANVNAALTSGRVTFATTDGLLTDSAGLTFDGTNFTTTGTATAAKLIPTGTSVTGNGMYLPATNSVGISTAGTNAVYIDASQNVGIGTVSPSSRLSFGANIGRDFAVYEGAGGANKYGIGMSGAGTGGDPYRTKLYANGAEYLCIDSNGLVGIGTSLPSTKLVVSAGRTTLSANNENYSLQLNNGATLNGPFLGSAGADIFVVSTSGGTERMRIDSSGRVGIGCTPAAGIALDVANSGILRIRSTGSEGGQIDINNSSDASTGMTIDVAGTDVGRIFQANNNCNMQIGQLVGTGGQINFYTASTLRATIDSSGTLLVGITSNLYSNAKLAVYNTTGGIGGIVVGYGSTAGQYRTQYLFGSNGHYYFDSGTNAAYLSSAGAWTNASDARLKNSIVDIQHGLSAVMNTKPRSYKMNNLDGNYIGFVAQELQIVIPEVVSGDPEKHLGVDYGSLVAVAFKAIQEQQALIESLTTRLTALEQK